MDKWKFGLHDDVRISVSGEVGTVIGRAEYASSNERSFLLRYRAADGCAVESWWPESALKLRAQRVDA